MKSRKTAGVRGPSQKLARYILFAVILSARSENVEYRRVPPNYDQSHFVSRPQRHWSVRNQIRIEFNLKLRPLAVIFDLTRAEAVRNILNIVYT